MSEDLFRLLRRRMADESVGPDDPLGVAELHKRLLPYHLCRDSLGYATKAEYDMALLRLLADGRHVSVSEPALREAVQSEIRQPEPGLAFLQRFAASEIRLKDMPAPERNAPPETRRGAPGGAVAQEAGSGTGPTRGAGPDCRRCTAPLPARERIRYCPACGADQVVPTCADCGGEIDEGWRYCAFCGKLQDGGSL